MVFVVKGSRVSMALINKFLGFILIMKCVTLHGNHGHRREHHNQTGSRVHDGNAECGDIPDPDDGNHDHSRRDQQASRQEPTQHWPS